MEGNRIEKRTDLLRGVTLTRLDRLFAEGDKRAHKFVIGLTLGNSVVTLDSGATVTGHFIRADDSTLPPIKGTVEEGKAVLTLPEGAYKITGYFSLIIKANVGEMSCAVFWGDGAITRTSTDTIVDPDHTIPSLDELLTKIAAVDDAIARADAAAEEARQAAQSANFTVLDHYDTLALLKVAHPTGKPGDAYAIGMEEPYDVHIWGVDVQDWVNIGQLQGAQGPKGDKPIKGVDYWTAEDKQEIKDYIDENIETGNTGAKYGKAVFFGDSITQGVGNNDISYVDYLAESGAFESVVKHGMESATIVPYQGDTYADYALINQINRYASDVQKADLVFIEYGANDATRAESFTGFKPGFATDSASDTTVCGYARKAIERVKTLAPNAQIIWLKWMPWRPDGNVPYDTTEENKKKLMDAMLIYESTLYRMARNLGCMLIDLSDGILYGDSTFYASDGVHANAAGYQRAARTLIANMYKNSDEKNLYRIYTIAAENTEGLASARIDGDFALALSMLRAGGIDVSLNLDIKERYFTHCKPVFFSEEWIVFGTITRDATNQAMLTVAWMPDGNIVFTGG